MRILSAGESHGQAIVAILEGFPKGIKIEASFINKELRRRMYGFGRGKRMQIEQDKADIIAGLRNKITLGSPLCIVVNNRDCMIFSQKNDTLPPLSIPRPGHADLAGCLKYAEKDIRNILERSSARGTVARVCAGAVCKQFLSHFGVKLGSFVMAVGSVASCKKPKNVDEIIKRTKQSQLGCIDSVKEKLMLKEIKNAQTNRDTVGGVIEVWAEDVVVGLGSCMHFDRRLDGKIASYLMSIPSIKGVEIGGGFEYARKLGSQSHDALYFAKQKGFYHKANSSGGIEGGISNGEVIVARIAAKPIPTLMTPLGSVNLVNKTKQKAIVERSDVCVVAAIGVIAESMIAIAVTESLLEKFGCDSLEEIKRNYHQYLKAIS